MCFNFHEIEIPIHINEKIESNEVADISHGNNHLKIKHNISYVNTSNFINESEL